MTRAHALSIEPGSAHDVALLSLIADECGLDVDFPAELARSYAWLRVARHGPVVVGFLLAWRAADEIHLTGGVGWAAGW